MNQTLKQQLTKLMIDTKMPTASIIKYKDSSKC